MRLRVSNDIICTYATPARSLIHVVRLTPRSHDGQHVVNWRVDVDTDCRISTGEDAFGNLVHTFYTDGPISKVDIHVEGEVVTADTAGVVRGTLERFPPELFLRDTEVTLADAEVKAFARNSCGHEGSRLDRLHALMGGIRQTIVHAEDGRSGIRKPAHAVLVDRKGDATDCAHLFIACARALDIPARYVHGHLLHVDEPSHRGDHAWAEGFVEGLGWVGFDCVNDVCPHEGYLRIACALDHSGATPLRASRTWGAGEGPSHCVRTTQAFDEDETSVSSDHPP